MRLRGDTVAGVLCGLFALLWITTALGLPYMGDYAPGSGFLPLWLGVCLLLLSTIHVVASVRAPSATAATGHWRKVVAVALGLVVCVAVIEPVGFVVAVGLYLLFLLRGVERESWRTSVGLSIAVVAVLFALFRLWLKVPLPKGPWGF
ncbi:MAG TPA: tripartite tricarboxylate transporter TctB family protein [Casimicrobiaceae bacterium]|nr:tripartite tricarboxylate transporter TctB family protein [Casimicrobiaceae bacterium]